MRGRVAEVFGSIQGEGLYVGERQIFVRLHGCNLECGYCDTPQDVYTEYEPQELLDELALYEEEPYRAVSFTGGEPLLQKDFLKSVLQKTHARLMRNYLETNGTLPGALRDVLVYLDVIAMDIKLPSSGGGEDMKARQQEFLRLARKKETFVKAVITASTTDTDILRMIDIIRDAHPAAILVLQPDSEGDQERIGYNLRRIQDICRNLWVTTCIVPQMHKAIGVK